MNLADLNSKPMAVLCFEYLMNKIMVRKELPTQTKGNGIKQAQDTRMSCVPTNEQVEHWCRKGTIAFTAA